MKLFSHWLFWFKNWRFSTNVCKWFIVSLNSDFGNSTIFVYFSWCPLPVNLLWCQECTFYCVPRKKSHIVLPTHSTAQLSKRFKPSSVTILLWHGHCWIEKKKTHKKQQKYKLFMVLPIWPSSTLKFLFVFDFK